MKKIGLVAIGCVILVSTMFFNISLVSLKTNENTSLMVLKMNRSNAISESSEPQSCVREVGIVPSVDYYFIADWGTNCYDDQGGVCGKARSCNQDISRPVPENVYVVCTLYECI